MGRRLYRTMLELPSHEDPPAWRKIVGQRGRQRAAPSPAPRQPAAAERAAGSARLVTRALSASRGASSPRPSMPEVDPRDPPSDPECGARLMHQSLVGACRFFSRLTFDCRPFRFVQASFPLPRSCRLRLKSDFFLRDSFNHMLFVTLRLNLPDPGSALLESESSKGRCGPCVLLLTFPACKCIAHSCPPTMNPPPHTTKQSQQIVACP